MKLGAFSVSLAVKDLKKSNAFYEKLGFEQVGGNVDHHYLILRNENTVIGLFQGMFEDNILTFNPGWDQQSNTLESYQDVRELEKQLQEQGIEIVRKVEENTAGPGSFVVTDPDGNHILVDQHI